MVALGPPALIRLVDQLHPQRHSGSLPSLKTPSPSPALTSLRLLSYSHDLHDFAKHLPAPFTFFNSSKELSPPPLLLYKWQHTSATSLAAAVRPPPPTEKPRHVVAQSRPRALPPSTSTQRLRLRHRRQHPERHDLGFTARTVTTPLLWFHHLFVIRPMIRVIPTKIAARPPIGLRTTSHQLK